MYVTQRKEKETVCAVVAGSPEPQTGRLYRKYRMGVGKGGGVVDDL